MNEAAMAATALPWGAMTATFPWGLLAVLTSLIAGWSLLIIVTVRWQMSRILAGYDDRFLGLEKDVKKLRQSHMEMKADLPLQYVRREDHIRQEVVINAKLDKLYELIDEIRRGKNGRNRPEKSQT